MGWVSLLAGLVRLANFVAGIVEKKQLMDAGAAKAIAAGLKDVLGNVEKARRARDATTNPVSDSDRDFGSGVRERHTRPDE